MVEIAPYGSWKSPISLDMLVKQVVALSYPWHSGGDVYWLEARPDEGGRQVIVRLAAGEAGGTASDVFGPDFNARTLVHEYGGIPYAVADGVVYFSNFLDQRLYRVAVGDALTGSPEPITGEPEVERSVRFAQPVVAPGGRFLLAVREQHPEPDVATGVVNDIVVIPTDGSAEPRVITSGHDFYSHVTVSPSGDRVAWISWDHPNMPWDGTELWEAELHAGGTVGEARRVAGGPAESVTQPKYSPQGVLHFVSDRTGWWNLYSVGAGGEAVRIVSAEAEFAVPDWVFGMSSYVCLADGSILASWQERGIGRLGLLRPGADGLERLETEFTTIALLQASDDHRVVVANAGSPTEARCIVRIDPALAAQSAGAPAVSVLKRSRATSVDARHLSVPQAIEFPTGSGLTAHGLFYPPHNSDHDAPEGELPPLIVESHGGPTSAFSAVLDYGKQFWTSRGFAVVDVNYGGSTGYGREYRERLRGKWGIVDLDDCVNAARYLASTGRVDARRLLIHGGSAGGYTTLCAVTFRDVFAAGASHFGVADAAALARDTHKFESRYLDSMIGPLPEAQAVYEERSPIFHTDLLRTPLIVFQGLEDRVVPPNQAEAMVAALAEKGIPHAYLAYEGEQHGFRRAENVRRTAEAELYFYARVLGFTPAEDLEPVPIENDDKLPIA